MRRPTNEVRFENLSLSVGPAYEGAGWVGTPAIWRVTRVGTHPSAGPDRLMGLGGHLVDFRELETGRREGWPNEGGKEASVERLLGGRLRSFLVAPSL